MRRVTADEGRRRLVSRQFLGLGDSVIDATTALVGLHATNLATPFLSLWARCPGFIAAELEDELYRNRSVLRHLAMRRTLWVVRADDLPIIQCASDRVAANEHRRLVADLEKADLASDGTQWLAAAVPRYWTIWSGTVRSVVLNCVPHCPRSADTTTLHRGSPGAEWFRWRRGF